MLLMLLVVSIFAGCLMVQPYYERDGITIYNCDCREVVRFLDARVIDSIVTDPPYGLEFMGKAWDHGVPGFEFWDLLKVVCKPGAMLLAFGGTRKFHRLACAIEDSGWEIRDCINWLYGSGFPKSLDISKAIDKAGGQPWGEFSVLLDSLIKTAGFNYTTLDQALGIPSAGSNSCYWVRTDERGGLPPRHYYEKLKELLSPPRVFTDLYDKAEREVIAIERRKNAPSGIVGAGRESVDIDRKITEPATDAAKQWQGWGTALKPAWEPIIVAMKALDGTFAQNALKHGVAGFAVDRSRVPLNGDYKCGANGRPSQTGLGDNYKPDLANQHSEVGRFPANVIHDGSDEVLAGFPQQTSGANPTRRGSPKFRNAYGEFEGQEECVAARGAESGSAARFFYCAKASKKDRGEDNTHPTVKPSSLMEYLLQLVSTPTGGLVLDPFMGSGSTLVAAKALGRKAIGIEINKEYCDIAIQRLAGNSSDRQG